MNSYLISLTRRIFQSARAVIRRTVNSVSHNKKRSVKAIFRKLVYDCLGTHVVRSVIIGYSNALLTRITYGSIIGVVIAVTIVIVIIIVIFVLIAFIFVVLIVLIYGDVSISVV